MKPETLYLLFNKKLNGEISNHESVQLQQWLDEASKNEMLWQQVQSIWQSTGSLQLSLIIDHDKAWDQIQDKINTAHKVQPLWQRPLIRVAAAVLIIALAALGYYLQAPGDTSYQTMAGQTLEVLLPDGSRVWLNENSQLSYENSFNKAQREVQLLGEGFFEVTRDPQRSFIIHSEQITTTVLGTTFNVRSDGQHNQAEVTVASGRVQVEAGDQEAVTLTAGDRALWNGEQRQLQKIIHQDPNFLAWKDKKLVFENTELSQVIKDLEEYFGVTIALNNQDIAQCQLTSTFQEPRLAEVLEVLALTLNLNYTLNGDEYLISGAGCITD